MRAPNETTLLYAEALKLIHEQAVRLNKPLTYTFRSSIPNMIAWAQSPTGGLQVVGHWDTESVFGSNYVHAVKLVTP